MEKRSAYAKDRCTALRPTGKLCGMPPAEGAPFPLCRSHVEAIYLYVEAKVRAAHDASSEVYEVAVERRRLQERNREERESFAYRRKQAAEAQSLVYYVRMGDHIKIGYSTNMTQRLVALRVSKSAVLATEPGGRTLEAQRHRKFAAERVGRREDFNPSPALLAHIEQIQADHGEPTITSWPAA